MFSSTPARCGARTRESIFSPAFPSRNLAVCGKEAVAKGIKAGELVKSVSAVCGGKGGGKPDSAMGGGTEVSKVDDALAAVDDLILSKLG